MEIKILLVIYEIRIVFGEANFFVLFKNIQLYSFLCLGLGSLFLFQIINIKCKLKLFDFFQVVLRNLWNEILNVNLKGSRMQTGFPIEKGGGEWSFDFQILTKILSRINKYIAWIVWSYILGKLYEK